MLYRIAAISMVLVAACSSAEPPSTATPQAEHTLDVNGTARTYFLHVPESVTRQEPMPLVIAFHGLGGHGSRMNRLTALNDIADREGFIVVYPNGQDGSWIDAGPDSLRLREESGIEDLAFVDALIDEIDAQNAIDNDRIYAAGISNGALFSYILACQRTATFAAVALVAGAGISAAAGDCRPDGPISYIAFHGTDDSIVPYDGAEIAPGFPDIGRYLNAKEAAAFWADHNRCSAEPVVIEVEDGGVIDNSTAIIDRYESCDAGTSVELYTLENGGHTWPGHPPTTGALGGTNRDIDASEIIWDFFLDHPKQ